MSRPKPTVTNLSQRIDRISAAELLDCAAYDPVVIGALGFEILTMKVKGKTHGYLESCGCGSMTLRTFTYTARSDPEPDGFVTTANAGCC